MDVCVPAARFGWRSFSHRFCLLKGLRRKRTSGIAGGLAPCEETRSGRGAEEPGTGTSLSQQGESLGLAARQITDSSLQPGCLRPVYLAHCLCADVLC